MKGMDIRLLYNKRAWVIALVIHALILGAYWTRKIEEPKPEPLKITLMPKVQTFKPKAETMITKAPQEPVQTAAKPAPVPPAKAAPKVAEKKAPVVAPKPAPKKAEVAKVSSPKPKFDTPKPVAPKVAQSAPVPAPPKPAPVEGFKFSHSEMSSLMGLVKGEGHTKNVEVAANNESVGGSRESVQSGDSSGAVQYAKTEAPAVGSFEGIAGGKLDGNVGTKGLVNKKGIYTVGIPSQTVIVGAMDPSIIRKILMEYIPQFRSCYQRELDRASSAFDGVMPLDFTIGPVGKVTRADVTDSSLPDNVRSCVVSILRGIPFPKPFGGGMVDVKQPLNFYQRSIASN
jgi:hypothetical protein